MSRKLLPLSMLLAGTALPYLAACAPEEPAGEAFDSETRARLGLPSEFTPLWVPVATSRDEGYSAEQAARNAPDILSFAACHVGDQRLLFRVRFARPPRFAASTFILYADLDNDLRTGRQDQNAPGVDVMVVLEQDNISLSLRNPAYTPSNTQARGVILGSDLYITLDAPLLTTDQALRASFSLLSEYRGGRSDSTPRTVVELPRADRPVPALQRGVGTSLRPLTDYRYHDDKIKLEKLEDKGLTYQQVAPVQPVEFGRPRPAVPFAAVAREAGREGSADRQQVRVQLLEEAGVRRSATPITFGFPFPAGAVFDPARIRVLTAAGQELPAQITATSFWPDNSLRWVLVDLTIPLDSGEERHVVVEFGREVARADTSTPLRVTEDAATLSVVTGPLRVAVDKARFTVLGRVWCDSNGDGQFSDAEQVAWAAPEGLTLLDEHGKLFGSALCPPDTVAIEERGPQKIVIRAEGKYGSANGETYMRYIARLTFWAGSSRVTLAVTHIDDYLQTEFADLSSLALPVVVDGADQATLYRAGQDGSLQRETGTHVALFQADERVRNPGLIRCSTRHGHVTAVIHDFWQRWPKGLAWDSNRLVLGLLPAQPGAEYGNDLPGYLRYPFVEGRYRFKWGMAITERVTLDFGHASPEEVLADAQMPVIAVVPAEWYAQTGALGPLAPLQGQQFAAWDSMVARSFEGFMRARDQTREYGYLNYGDWYGERGRNWGNNEYDTAHGFFMQFARTGERRYFRAALAAARHQADVDCVHAYPDPGCVGGNLPHSVCHTGSWSETLEHGTWSYRYGGMATAANGHTWADGMVDAWHLAGEARVMEAALSLGEHIAWVMSRQFKELGTHERSAGWSLRAILALYSSTYDPEYLEAARRIAAVALREQKLDQGGGWPHVLPADHAGDRPGAVGNNLFLIGILLGGLQAYHEATGDPAALKSLIAGAGWVSKSWDETAGGWPYSATVAGEPLYKPTAGLNMLIIQPLAYVASQTGDQRLMQIVETALTTATLTGDSSFGKSLSQQMFFSSGILALLQSWYATHRPDKGLHALDGGPETMRAFMLRTPDATRHSVRAPDQKVFFVRLKDGPTELLAVRKPHGAKPKGAATGTIRVTDSTGALVAEDTFSTDLPHEFRCALRGEPGAEFQVVVDDDQRGVWTLSGEGLAIIMHAVPDFSIGGIGRGRYHFFVPAGTREFRIKLLGVHPGPYGGMVVTPAGEIAAFHQDANPGQTMVPGVPQVMLPKPDEHPERGTLTVTPAAEDTGKMWSVILWAAGDLGCVLEGVPPYLALREEDWFAPTAR